MAPSAPHSSESTPARPPHDLCMQSACNQHALSMQSASTQWSTISTRCFQHCAILACTKRALRMHYACTTHVASALASDCMHAASMHGAVRDCTVLCVTADAHGLSPGDKRRRSIVVPFGSWEIAKENLRQSVSHQWAISGHQWPSVQDSDPGAWRTIPAGAAVTGRWVRAQLLSPNGKRSPNKLGPAAIRVGNQ